MESTPHHSGCLNLDIDGNIHSLEVPKVLNIHSLEVPSVLNIHKLEVPKVLDINQL